MSPPTALFAEWCPDQPDLSQHSKFILNVRPRTATSYGPMQALNEYGSALNGECKGVGSFEGSDGTAVIFAGTATALYSWNGTDWDDVTRALGPYTLASENRWTFEQFGDYVYADNGVDAPQVWEIAVSTLFTAATGSPPTSKYLATVRSQFLFRANTTTDRGELQWSSQFDSNEWVVGTNQGDLQTFTDGGRITGIVGGQYVVIFQIHKITLGTYVGPDLIFQFDEVSRERGCIVPGSIASIEQTIFFLDHDGFYRIDGGQTITQIGDGKVDEEIWANIDQDNFNAVWSAIDPRRKLYIIAWPTSSGIADTVWTYHWPSGRWAPSAYDIECLFFMLPSLNINFEDFAALYPDPDAPGVPSIDSDQFLANPIRKLGAFSSNHKLAFFDGANLEATLDTAETQLGGGTQQVEVDRLIPLIDGGTPQGKLGYRNRQADTITYSAAVAMDSYGDQWFRAPPARFHRARQIIPAASTWSHAQGVTFELSAGGDR